MAHPLDYIKRFVNLPPELRESLREHLQERRFRRGEHIEGSSINHNEFYIVSGMARVYYIENGIDHTYSFAIEDEFIVLSGVMLRKPDSVMCIEFLEPTTVVYVPHAPMHQVMKNLMPELREEMTPFVITALFEHMKYLDERLLVMQNTSARSRYDWFVTRYPRLLERAPITQIASFLGLTKETLYRIRSNKYTGK